MYVSAQFVGRIVRLAGGAALLSGCLVAREARAQAPYLLPNTIQTLAGGGTPLTANPPVSVAATPTTPMQTAGLPCQGPGAVGFTYDEYGDGCQITSTSVVLGDGAVTPTSQGGGNEHDVAVDQQGNIYFIDESASSSSTGAVVRRIDARSGVITVYVGSFVTQSPCVYQTTATLADKYGDGCPANDGKANYGGFYTDPATMRGLGIAKNGDLYMASYSDNLIHKVTAATGMMSYAAGYISGGGTPGTSTAKSNVGQAGFTGNGGLATNAELKQPRGVGVDAAGNLYIADSGNNVVREVIASTGVINDIAGSSSAASGATGDGGPAINALLNTPEDVVVDANGNVFIADEGNAKVRVIYQGGAVVAKLIALTNPGTVATQGYIYTIMGGGTGTYGAGTYILATSGPIAGVRKISVDAHDNVYLADNSENVIDFLDASTGFMHVLAGSYGKTDTLPVTSTGSGCTQATDSIGDNCPAVDGLLFPNSAMGVAVDGSGNVYISDAGNNRLRKVTTNQVFPATTAGTPVTQMIDVHFSIGDSPAAINPFVISGSPDFSISANSCSPAATLNADTTVDCLVSVVYTPSVAGAESASLTVNSTLNGSSIFALSGTGVAATVAFDPGTVSAFVASGMNAPASIAQDAAGNTYIADTGNNRVVRYAPGGAMTVVAGTGTNTSISYSGPALQAALNAPAAVAVAPNGTIYIADSGNNVLRAVNPATGVISTVGGGGTVCATAIDAVGDSCPATSAKFLKPSGLISDSNGNIYISDTGNNLIRELSLSGYVYLIGGGANPICAANTDSFGDGCNPAQAIFNAPTGLAIDASNNVYVADTGDNEVRELVASTAQVVLLAGSAGIAGAGGNGGPANGAQLNGPTGLAVDAAGNLYIADTGNAAVRIVDSLKTISTVAGTLGTAGTGTIPGPANGVLLSAPAGVVSNGAGNLIILDSGNSRALAVNRGSVTYNLGRTNLGFSSPTVLISETSTGSVAATLGTLFTTTGTPAEFTLTATGSNGCSSGTSLGIGGSCQLIGQFTPTALGAVSATYTEAGTNTINSPAPFIKLSGTGAVLTPTTAAVALTPAVSPQYAIPFTVTATVTANACNTAAPDCYPTGTVNFFVDGVGVGGQQTLNPGTSPTSTSASVPFSIASPLNVGPHKITAVYNGDSFYAAGTTPVLSVTIATETTTSSVVATPNPVPQFQNLTLTATVKATSGNPTGTFSFYAGTTLLKTAGVNGVTGQAVVSDVLVTQTSNGVTTVLSYPNSFGLPAGTYCITAQYSGDANYSASTSPCTTLVISADPQTFSISSSATATGAQQGSTGQVTLNVTPSNTLSGNVTFSCTGVPVSSVCTFTPTTLTFVPTPLVANGQLSTIAQSTVVALWTSVPPGVTPSASLTLPGLFGRSSHGATLASLLGWPLLLFSTAGIVSFRKQRRRLSLLTALALFGMLVGSTVGMTACSKPVVGTPTPLGVYTIVLTATGPTGTTTQTTSIQFTVTAGNPGGE